jgi:uncharacterized delta-60 repeat protein
MTSSTSILFPALNLFETQLELFATSPEFQSNMILAFGGSHEYSQFQQIFQKRKTGVLTLIEVVPLAFLNGAYGAFSRDTNKIYLASEFIISATPSAIADVLLEEYGHYIDAQLNHVETLGDEGEIFADLVQGSPINPSAFTEDDTEIVNINGNWITVEQAAGDLDPSFGGGSGLFMFPVPGVSNATVSGVEVQADGKIVVAGSTDFPSLYRGDLALMRFNSDGTNWDSTLGNGFVQAIVDDLGDFGKDYAIPGGLALQPNGKIIVAGSFAPLFDITNADKILRDIYLIRYNNDGSLDPSFSFDGIVRTNLGGIETVSSVLLQPDGKILVVGQVTFLLAGIEQEQRIFLTRYNSDGSLDTSFNNSGRVFTPNFKLFDFDSDAGTNVFMVLQPDGKVLVGFTIFRDDDSIADGNSVADFAFFRYNSDGSADQSFAVSGNGLFNVSQFVDQRTGSFDSLDALAVQPDGKIIAAGSSGDNASNLDLTLVRFNSNGTNVDPSFGVNGIAIADLGSDIFYGGVRDLKLQANGKIVVAAILKNGSFSLVRYNNNGTLDTSFGGSDGIAPIPIFPSFDEALTLQEDGKILVAGVSGNDVYAVARFLGDPVPVFDAAQYGASYPDLITGIGYNLDALTQHYQNSGRFESRQPDLFNEFRYIASNFDLIGAFGLNGLGATQHYITSGYSEGRSLTEFIPSRYLNSHNDLFKAFGTDTEAATQHYITSGFTEGREPNLFESDRYLASHSDLIQAYRYNLEAGSNHYLFSGRNEGRQVLFDPQAYLNQHGDLQAAFGSDLTAATAHYITNGFDEGRTWM